jgi:Flp pilus assembly protein TadG
MNQDERGATIVIVAISLVALLGMVALVIDVGKLFVERRELQNGADAAALAVAEGCARGLPECASPAAESLADTYADANASDGAAQVLAVDIDMAAQTVRVQLGTETADGSAVIGTPFAQVVGFAGSAVRAEATAQWSAGVGFPLAVSVCETRTSDNDPIALGEPVTLVFHDNPAARECQHSESGEDIDGGFGWLLVGDECFATIADGWIQGSTSVEPPTGGTSGCDMATLYRMLQGVVNIPVFDQVVGRDGGGGANTRYHIAHFATFEVTAFKIYTDAQHQGHTTVWNDPTCLRLGGGGMQTVCVDGHFLAHEVPVSEGITTIVRLID